MPHDVTGKDAGLAAWTGSAALLRVGAPEVPPGCAPEWWGMVVPLLRGALRGVPGSDGWMVLLQYRLLRLGGWVDAVLVTERAVLALVIRPEGGFQAGDRLRVEDAALDLADFHLGCRGVPVIPVLVAPNGAHAGGTWPLPLAGATPVLETTRLLLPGLLQTVATRFPPCGIKPAQWPAAPYRPVPALIDAACLLYAQHDVASLRLARTSHGGLAATTDAVRQAREARQHIAVFVTGDPGAGKTLCGLNVAFAPELGGAAFLTGNPTLVHVLREALVRDAASRGMDRRAAQRRMALVIQALPAFRDHYVRASGPPPERIVVIDEAQRCWSGPHAISKTRNRLVPLTDSEPGHVLDIMARHQDWAVLVCLLGGGQEIHAGEGGLATWGAALATRPGWQVWAPPEAQQATDPRQRLMARPGTAWHPALRLGTPVRSVGAPDAAAWVDAVLANDPVAAASIAQAAGGVPFQLTRCLATLRRTLRARGTRRSGLVASSGARRLRAEGMGSVLPHQDEDAVARWFLDRWPDVRASDALETAATEFAVQGLELRYYVAPATTRPLRSGAGSGLESGL